MRIGVLGTGMVGRALAEGLTRVGHDVMVGTRDVTMTLARSDPDLTGAAPFAEWHTEHSEIKLGTLNDAGAHGEAVVNATNGTGALAALTAAGADNLAGKAVLDISNPLDFSQGMPPSLFVKDTDSLGEQLQRAFPAAHIVKALNTITAPLMVAPKQLDGGNVTAFVSGNDAAAKATVIGLLHDLGWVDVIDLGDISTARGTEMLMPLWLRVWGALGTPLFGFKVVR